MDTIKRSRKQSQQMFQAMWRRTNVKVPTGKVRGTSHGLSPEKVDELLSLRVKDPKTFTFRRLGLIFGVTDSMAHYLVAGR